MTLSQRARLFSGSVKNRFAMEVNSRYPKRMKTRFSSLVASLGHRHTVGTSLDDSVRLSPTCYSSMFGGRDLATTIDMQSPHTTLPWPCSIILQSEDTYDVLAISYISNTLYPANVRRLHPTLARGMSKLNNQKQRRTKS